MKKVLITGVTGFAGSYLAEHLVAQNQYEITGICISKRNTGNITRIKDSIQLKQFDLTNTEQISDLLSEIKPDYIYHLAAMTSVKESLENPAPFITNNIAAQVNLLEAVKHNNLIHTRILIVASSDMYGLVNKDDLPIDETTPFHPTNPYAVSKITQDYLGLQYYLAYKLPIIRVRPFNHIGPRQAPTMAVSSFSKRIVDIEKGKSEPVLKVGNLMAKRDFTDVRDIVRAYAMVIEKGQPGEVYNIGSGKSYVIGDVLDMLLLYAKNNITVETYPELFRPADNPEFVCNAGKLHDLTGWQPEISLERSLKDILDYWRKFQ